MDPLGGIITMAALNGILGGASAGMQYEEMRKQREFQEKMARQQAELAQEQFNAQQEEMQRQIGKEQQSQNNISEAVSDVLFKKPKKKKDEIFAPDAFSYGTGTQ